MENKRFLMFFVTALLIIGLSACVKPASQAPKGTATPTTEQGGFPLPGTSDVMGQLEQAATQTAIAMSGTSSVPETPTGPTAGASEATATVQVQVVETTAVPPAQPTSTLVPVPSATPGIPTSYTLHKGEFPYCIARRFNVNPGELLNLNGLSVNSTYYAGMTLRIPQTGDHFPGNRTLRAHPSTYTVTSGDTIYSISCLYGDVDPSSIAIANNLSAPYSLSSGTTIQIP
jgi:LysM repeat protein